MREKEKKFSKISVSQVKVPNASMLESAWCTHAASGRRAAQRACPVSGLVPRELVRLSI